MAEGPPVTHSISEISLIRGETTAAEWCDYLGTQLAKCLPPPAGSRPIYSWHEFEWFWFKLSRSKDEAPGDWALLKSYDISGEVTREEGIVWGDSQLIFARENALTGSGCSKIQSDEQYELAKKITTDLHWSHKKIVAQLEMKFNRQKEYVYSDPSELDLKNVSSNMLRQRRAWLLEVIEAYLNIAVTFRVTLPESNYMPNKKITDAFMGGWIPIDYVGPLKTGSAVVFHPAIKGPP